MICMVCSTPTKLQHFSRGCNTPVSAETTSSSGFFSHCVLTTLLTSFQGICVPEAEGESDLVGRSPQSVPLPTHSAWQGVGVLGRKVPAHITVVSTGSSGHLW